MKKLFIVPIAIALIIFLVGCNATQPVMKNPVNVYYCREKVDYNSDMGAFASKQLDFGNWEDRILPFLNFYISAPVGEGMISPFPAGAGINGIEYQDSLLNVQLNLQFSGLSASELSVACACISLTLFELTDAYSISFSFYGINNETVAVMSRDNLKFKDISAAF